VHRSLPELSLDQIDLSTTLGTVPLAHPVLINAMTGGAPGLEVINRDLAEAAGVLGVAMAVGSQTAALRDPQVAHTYRIVRSTNPKGVIIANVGAGVELDDARRAVEMIEANLLQIHLNAPQELVMAEGDRDFRGQLARMEQMVSRLSVPVIVKECGFGLARESIMQLQQIGVRIVDVAGRGGTNFAWIEAMRIERPIDPGLEAWGLPTAAALAESLAARDGELAVIASGGIRRGSEGAKALAMGADAVAIAGPVLAAQQEGGALGAATYLQNILHEMRCAALLCGAQNLSALHQVPVVITGTIGEWCRLRGVPVEGWARRGRNV
jgi:isopentenyl-diphosphate delta-isomerase